jgi:NitT/TauT family transport system permease protein
MPDTPVKQKKAVAARCGRQRLTRVAAVVFWLAVWQLAAWAIGQEVFLASPLRVAQVLVQLLPTAAFWQRVAFSSGRILLGFALGLVASVLLALAAHRWRTAEILIAPLMQLIKATPVASFIILALVWVRGRQLSVLISFLMVLPVLYGAVRTGLSSVNVQLLEMARVFRLPWARRLRAVWLPAVLPAFRQGCGVALGICWKSGVAAEVIGLPDGSIGDALYRAKITLATGELFAWTLVIIALSAVFETLFLAALDAAAKRLIGEGEAPNA